MESVLGIKKCQKGDLLISLLFLLTCMLLAYIAFLIITGEQRLKEIGGWRFAKGEFILSKSISIKLTILALITGFIGSIIGVGGNMIISPVLLEMGMAPQVISTTGQFLIFLNKAVASTVFIVTGVMPLDYLLVMGLLSMVSVGLANWRFTYFLKKYGR